VGLADFPSFDSAVRVRLAAATDRLAGEFTGVYDRDEIAVLVDESARRLASGTAGVTAFVPILAERFARERLRAQALADGRLAKTVPEVVFVSLTGGGRAQIGAALLARSCGAGVNVHSAGSHAGTDEDENVRLAMAEIGIDLSREFTKPLTAEVLAAADVVVTMGRSVGEVEIPASTRHADWRVGDPAGAPLDEVRRVRNDIERRVRELTRELVDLQAARAQS
jgi:protein-tyrosine-phosphatase